MAHPDPPAAKQQPTPQLHPPELGPLRADLNHLNNPADKIDLSSPEATARSFVWAINNGDIAQARLCVLDAAPLEELHPLKNTLSDFSKYSIALIGDLHSYSFADDAIVTLWLNVISSIRITENFGSSSERFQLRRVNGNWLIQPQQNEKAFRGRKPFQQDFLVNLAVHMTDGKALQAGWALGQCQSNLKQIGLGVLMYVQDHDGKYPNHATWEKQLAPYLRNSEIFHCPADKVGATSYSFNTALDDGTFDIQNPQGLILAYEGQDRKFEFRHSVEAENLTVVLFADGHIKSFTEKAAEAALKDGAVRWTP